MEAGREAWEQAGEEERETWMEEGRQAWTNMDNEQREKVYITQNIGRSVTNENRFQKAMEKYKTPGIPPIQSNSKVWECSSLCQLRVCETDKLPFFCWCH